MRYLPLTDADRRDMLAKIGVANIDALFDDVPKAKRLDRLIDLPKTKGELEVERAARPDGGKNVAAGSVPFFVGAGAYKHHVPATVDHLIQRSEFLDFLHALSAGNRAGHAAVSLRVPDAGGDADGHGGGECLHVRRLDGGGGSGADGASRDAAAQGDPVRQPASALSRDRRDDLAHGGRRGGGAGAARSGRGPDRD